MVQKVFETCDAKNATETECCRPEQMGTKEFAKMLKRIQTLEDGRVPAKEAKHWKLEGQRKESRERSIRGL